MTLPSNCGFRLERPNSILICGVRVGNYSCIELVHRTLTELQAGCLFSESFFYTVHKKLARKFYRIHRHVNLPCKYFESGYKKDAL